MTDDHVHDHTPSNITYFPCEHSIMCNRNVVIGENETLETCLHRRHGNRHRFVDPVGAICANPASVVIYSTEDVGESEAEPLGYVCSWCWNQAVGKNPHLPTLEQIRTPKIPKEVSDDAPAKELQD